MFCRARGSLVKSTTPTAGLPAAVQAALTVASSVWAVVPVTVATCCPHRLLSRPVIFPGLAVGTVTDSDEYM